MTLLPTLVDFSTTAFRWLDPLVEITGFAVAAWAYRLSRKIGYLIIAGYFLLVVCSTIVLPAVNSMLYDRWEAHREAGLSPQQQAQFVRDAMALTEKYYPPGGAAPAKLTLDIRLGPMILVSGLWLLARRESRRVNEKDDTT